MFLSLGRKIQFAYNIRDTKRGVNSIRVHPHVIICDDFMEIKRRSNVKNFISENFRRCDEKCENLVRE